MFLCIPRSCSPFSYLMYIADELFYSSLGFGSSHVSYSIGTMKREYLSLLGTGLTLDNILKLVYFVFRIPQIPSVPLCHIIVPSLQMTPFLPFPLPRFFPIPPCSKVTFPLFSNSSFLSHNLSFLSI